MRFENPFREGTGAVYDEDENVSDMVGGSSTPFLFLSPWGPGMERRVLVRGSWKNEFHHVLHCTFETLKDK